ncbi:MAG: WD40 repeat domain-containing protein, partial [Planctomycetota bacterium]
MFSRQTGIWWVVLAALMAGMLFVAMPPAQAQDDADETDSEEANDDSPKQWPLVDYEDPGRFLQEVVVAPSGKEVYYNQYERLVGDEWARSYGTHRMSYHTLDTESGATYETREAFSKAINRHNDVVDIQFSPDGKYMLLTLMTKQYPAVITFIVRDAKTGKTVNKIANASWAYARWVGKKIAITRLIDNTKFGFVTLYSAKSKKGKRTKYRGRVLAANVKGDRLVMMANTTKPTLATDHRESGIIVLNAATGEIIHRLRAQKLQRTTLAYMSPSGEYAVVGRICWDNVNYSTTAVYQTAIFSTKDPDKSLVIRRTGRIMPVAVTDEGKAVVISSSSGYGAGALKLVDINGKSRTLIPFSATGATVHGKMAYCVVRSGAEGPTMRAVPLKLDVELTD